MQALKEQSEPVTARELFYRHVLPAVRARASQTPQMFPMREGHGGGELVLLPTARAIGASAGAAEGPGLAGQASILRRRP
jgi:hypothetical protein